MERIGVVDMNFYVDKDKNVTRWLAVLVLGIFLVSVMPTPFANETETALYTETPTAPGNYDAIEFFQSFGEEVENSRSKTAWERLNAPLQTYVETGIPTPEMVILQGQPRALVIADPEFDLVTLPEGLRVGRVANLRFLQVFEVSISEPSSLLVAAGLEGILALDADVYLDGRTAPSAPTLETEVEWKSMEDTATNLVEEIGVNRPVVRTLSGANQVQSVTNGTGVRLSIMDTGVDFGIPNLARAIDLDSAGYPTSYDDGGEGLLYAPISAIETASGVIPAGDDWMYAPLQRGYNGGTDQAFDLWTYYYYLDVILDTGPGGSWQSIKVPTGISKSGIWKVGITRIGAFGSQYRWPATFFCDPNIAGVYDRMYIDWEASFAISMSYSLGIENWEWGRSEVNWDITDEHSANNYWDMMETPQRALGADPVGLGIEGPEVWAMTGDYWNGTFLGMDSWGAHVDSTFDYQGTTSAAANYTDITMEYSWIDNPVMPWYDEDNLFNVSLNMEYNGTVGGLTNGSYQLNGLFAEGDVIRHRFYGINATGEEVLLSADWINTTLQYAVDVDAAFEDGYPDISFGSLSHMYDSGGLVDGWDYIAFMTGDSDETYASTFYDGDTHGTRVAMDAVARGQADNASIPMYDVFQNGTLWDLRGSAPDASLMAVKIFSSASTFWSWMWVAGIDATGSYTYLTDAGSYPWVNTWAQDSSALTDLGSGMWVPAYLLDSYNTNPMDIFSNSWGFVAWYGPSRSWTNLMTDMLTLPNSVSAGYPGMLHVWSAGNSGPGYASSTGPASELAVQVGAITTGHPNDDFYGPGQLNEELAPFTSKGPTTYGNPAPQILAWGAWHMTYGTIDATWNGYEGVATFGGTSASAPTATGLMALILEQGGGAYGTRTLDPLELKNAVMSTARDIEADGFSQGAGIIDVVAGIDLVANGATTRDYIQANSTHLAMEWFIDDDLRDAYSANLGLNIGFNISQRIIDATIYTPFLEAGDSYNATVLQIDGITGAPTTNTPTASHHTLRTATNGPRMATLVPNATIDASFVGPANDTTGARRAWNLTDALFDNATYLDTWATGDGMVAIQIAPTSGSGSLFLHAWGDSNSDGMLQYRNATYLDPGADDYWNSYVSYSDGEAHRISFAYADAPTIWVRADTLANLDNMGYDLALVPGTTFAAGVNFTIWAEFYEKTAWSWVTVDTVANADGSFNVTVDVPAAAEPGQYEGTLQYSTGSSGTIAIDVAVSAEITQYIWNETAAGPAPIVTDEYLPGLIYDNGEFRQGDPAETGDGRPIWVYVDQWNASSIIVTQNWTNAGMDVFTQIKGNYGNVLGSQESSATATSLNVVAEIDGPGWYFILTQCYGASGETARDGIDMAVNWAYGIPHFDPLVNGAAFPEDNEGLGLMGVNGASNATLVWTPDAYTAKEFPTIDIVDSDFGFGVPPFTETLPWDSTNPYPDLHYPGDAPGYADDYWYIYAGSTVDIELHWEVGAANDMMDANFINADSGVNSWGNAMGTGGGSPEAMYDVAIVTTGNYYLEISNFDASDNHGTVYIYVLIPADDPSTSDTDTVSFNLDGLSEAVQWSVSSTAEDSWGYGWSAAATIWIRNIAPPTVEITSTIASTVSGTLALTISVTDANNMNPETADDEFVWIHIYYTADEAGQHWIPIATYINATDASMSDTVDITFSWDTTLAFNTYTARLFVVGEDVVYAASTVASDQFEIANTAGSGAGIGTSSESNSGVISVALLLIAVLGIGTIPMLRRFMRIRRR